LPGELSNLQISKSVIWRNNNDAAAAATLETTAEAGDYTVTNALVFVTDDKKDSGGMIVRAGNRGRAIVHIAPDGLKVFADGDSPNHVVSKGFLGKVTNSVLQISSQNFANVDAKLSQKLSISGGVMFADIAFDDEAALRHSDGANFIQFQSPDNENFVIAESRNKAIQIAENYEGDFLIDETDAGTLALKEQGYGNMIFEETDDGEQEFFEQNDGNQLFSETGEGNQILHSDSATFITSTNIIIGSTVSGAVVSVIGENISLQGNTTVSGVLNLAGHSITGVESIVAEKINITQTSEFHKTAQFFAGANFNNSEIYGVSTITVAKIITPGVIDPLGIEFIPTNAKPSGFSHPVLWASNDIIRNLCWEDKTVVLKENLDAENNAAWPNSTTNFFVKQNAADGNGSFEKPFNESEWTTSGNATFNFIQGNYGSVSAGSINNKNLTLIGHGNAVFNQINIPENGKFTLVNLIINTFNVPTNSSASVDLFNCKIINEMNEDNFDNCFGQFYVNGDMKLRRRTGLVHATGFRVDGNWNIGNFNNEQDIILHKHTNIEIMGENDRLVITHNGPDTSNTVLECRGNLSMQGNTIEKLAPGVEKDDATNVGQFIANQNQTNGIEIIKEGDTGSIKFGVKNFVYEKNSGNPIGTFKNLKLNVDNGLNVGRGDNIADLTVHGGATIDANLTAGDVLFVNKIEPEGKVGIGVSDIGITDKLTVDGEINAMNHRVLGVSDGTETNDAVNLAQMEQAIYDVKTNITSTIPTDLVQTYIKSGFGTARMCEIKKKKDSGLLYIRHGTPKKIDCTWCLQDEPKENIFAELEKYINKSVFLIKNTGSGIVKIKGPYQYSEVNYDGNAINVKADPVFYGEAEEGESLILLPDPDADIVYGTYQSDLISTNLYDAAIAHQSFGIEKSSSADGTKDIHVSAVKYVTGKWYFWYGRYDKSANKLYTNCNGIRLKVIFAPRAP